MYELVSRPVRMLILGGRDVNGEVGGGSGLCQQNGLARNALVARGACVPLGCQERAMRFSLSLR